MASIIPDELDFKILTILQEEPSISVRELSRKLRIPKSTVYYRLKTLEQSGYFKRAVIVNAEKLGFEYPVALLIKSRGGSEHHKRLTDILISNPYVQLVYYVLSDVNFVVIGKFPSRDKYMQFIDTVLDSDTITKVRTMVIARVYKENFDIPLIEI